MSRFFSRMSFPLFKVERRQFSFSEALCQAFTQKQPLEENPFYKKYSDKIVAVQSSSSNSKTHAEKQCSGNASCNLIPSRSVASNSSKEHTLSLFSSLKRKTLDSVMKVELLKDKSAVDIESIWKQYHKEKHGLYAVLPGDVYDKMHSKLEEYPTFLFPLPKYEGYEFIMSQYEANNIYFTSLINYQAHKENAPVYMTITYFPDLQDDKGIVLMRGEFDETFLKAHEAQCLTNHLQLYYGGDDPGKDQLLWNFNKKPEVFKHMDLIIELENILNK